MGVQNYFILTAAERTTAMGYNTVDAAIDPRAIDNSSPGVGINLNDAAAGYDPAEAVTLTDCYVAPKRIVDDPIYPGGLKTFLLTLPWASLEDETIFAPVV
jgi:hypothetical protein